MGGSLEDALSFLKGRKLRVDILTIFGGLLILTVLSVILYTYRNNSSVVLMLCDDIMAKTTDTVIDRTNSYLTPAAKLAKISSHMVAAGVIPLHDNARLERYAIEVMQAYPQIAMINIGDEAGNFLMPKRLSDGTIATKTMDRSVSPPLTTWKYHNRDLEVVKIETSRTDQFDPRTRPWYKGAKETRRLCWTDMYILFTDQKPGITTSYPIVGPQGNFLGAIGCDIELNNLSLFLKSLKIGKTGLAFIFNGRELVAFPDPTKLVDFAEDGVVRPVYLEELGLDRITAAFRQYRRLGRPKLTVETGGKRYVASFTSFPPSFGKPWKVGVIVPEDDFIGAVKQINQRVLIISLMALALSFILLIFFSRRISKPILRIAEETDRIGKFQLDGQLRLRSNIYEIQTLQEAVKRMKASLLSFTRFAPQQLVQEIVVEGKEAMLGGERREVTLFFSDLRNFTRFSEQTKPETVVHILNTHFDNMVQLINRHNGFVVDFLGDSLFAVFGAPDVDPEHASKAVSCAIDMQLLRQQMNLNETNLPPLEMGIGINTGTCVVGNMGSLVRIKYGVVGHAVNLASRIESFTVGGQVLISESTRQIIGDQFVVAGPLEAFGKGVESAIHLWELRGVPNQENKTLPPTVPGLTWLAKPILVHIRLFTGKQISPTPYEARLLQLSPSGAKLEAKLDLGAFAPLQVEIPGTTGESYLIDSKVVAVLEPESSFIIKFTGIDAAAAETLKCWLTQS
jgi:adenylate cyclase